MSDVYDGLTIGDIVSENELTNKNVNIYNASLIAIPTGNTAADGSPEMVVVEKGQSSPSYQKESDAIRIISIERSNALKGEEFGADIILPIASSEVILLSFETPSILSGKSIVWGIDNVSADVNYILYELLENVDFTGVTPFQPVQVNRQLDGVVVSEAQLWTAVSGFDDTNAVRIDLNATLGGQGGFLTSETGSTQSGREFYILKPETKYTIRLTNESTDDGTVKVKSTYLETKIGE